MIHRMIMCEFQNFWSSPWQNFSQALYSKFATKSAKITKQFWRLMTIAQCNRHNSNGKTSMHVRGTNQKFTPGWSGHVSHFFFWRLEVLHILPQDWHSFGDISTTKHAIAKMGTDSEPHGHLKLEKFWSQDDPTAFWQTQAHIWIQGTIHQNPRHRIDILRIRHEHPNSCGMVSEDPRQHFKMTCEVWGHTTNTTWKFYSKHGKIATQKNRYAKNTRKIDQILT